MRVNSSFIFFMLTSLLSLGSVFATPGGEVKLEISEPVLSQLLTRTLQAIDPYISLHLDFRADHSSKESLILNQGAVICRVDFQVAHLRFDSLEGVSSKEDLKPLSVALESIRKSLSRNSVRTLSFKFGLRLGLEQVEGDLEVRARIYPRSLRILSESLKDSQLDTLLNDVLRPLLLDRYSPLLLRALEKKYLRQLKVGKLLTLRASELEKNKTLRISVDLGQLNELNFLVFKTFATTDSDLILTGKTVSKSPGVKKRVE
jgi:hypothetical protein